MARKGTAALTLAGLVAAGFLVRSANFLQVFPGGGRVVFPGHDPYYHMRRVFLILQDYPAVPLLDGSMNFPFGAPIIWPPLFDLVMATVCLLCGFRPDHLIGVESVAAVVVPVIGALTVLPVFFLTRRLFDGATASLAGLFLVLAPSHVWYSRLGFVDHHVAVTLLHVLMVGAMLRALDLGGSSGTNRDSALRSDRVATLVLVVAAGFLTWNGFLGPTALLIGLLLVLLLVGGRDEGRKVSNLIWITSLSAAALVLPVAALTAQRTGRPLAWTTLSWFHVAALSLAGLLGLALRLAPFRRGSSPGRVARFSVPVLMVLTVAAFLVFAGVGVRGGLEWVLGTGPFMSGVDESAPLIHLRHSPGGGAMTLSVPTTSNLFHALFPIAWVLMLIAERRRRFAHRGRLVLLVWTAALFLLALTQRRFMESLAPAMAILIAAALVEVYRSFRKPVAAGVAVIITLGALVPWHAGWLHGGRGGGDPVYDLRLYDSLERFRRTVLGRPDRVQTAEPKREGAINPWPLGHRILYLTGLPVVSNNFGSHIGAGSFRDWSAFFLSADESDAVAILERRRIRYVIVDYDTEAARTAIRTLGRSEEEFFTRRTDAEGRILDVARVPFLESIFFRLNFLLGSEGTLPGIDGGTLEVPALTRLRLVQDTLEQDRGRVRVFELVEGARLSIACEPGESLRIDYRFVSDAGMPREYRQTRACGEGGRVEAVVPYPSDREQRGWASSYRIEAAGRATELFVPEEAIRSGRSIPVRWPSAEPGR